MGAIIASFLASKFPVRGLVLPAPPFRSLAEILVNQQKYILDRARISARHKKAILLKFKEDLKSQRMSENSSGEASLTNRFFDDYKKYDIRNIISNVTCPILIIQGDKDFQTRTREMLPLI